VRTGNEGSQREREITHMDEIIVGQNKDKLGDGDHEAIGILGHVM